MKSWRKASAKEKKTIESENARRNIAGYLGQTKSGVS
jgi:hypothetical protein